MLLIMNVLNYLILFLITNCKCSYDVSDKIVFPKLPNAAPRSENAICGVQSRAYIDHLDNMTLWAHQMMDASAKSYDGILVGANYHYGNFDECLSVRGPFRTQYCLVSLDATIPEHYKPVDPYSLEFHPFAHLLKRLYKTADKSQEPRNSIKVGWCIPASCTANDLGKALNDYIDKTKHPFNEYNVTYSASVDEKLCQREGETLVFDGIDISFCILSATLILLTIIGSIYDTKCAEKAPENKTAMFGKILSCFSLRESYKDLCRPEGSNLALRTLYGIRTFSIMMIVIDHRFGTFISGAIDNFDFIEREYRSIASWYLFHGDLFVDTFFVLSGILVTYGLLLQYSRKHMHPAVIFFFRYIRLTPVYAFVIFLWATMMRHAGDGPIWNVIGPKEAADCRKYWWTNLLYISNYIGASEMCMVHSWYLPCDTHYFIVAIFMVKLIHSHKRLGFIVLSFFYLLSVAIPFAITAVYMRPGLINFNPEFTRNPKGNYDYNLMYVKSHTRASTYILGMFAGYWFYKLKDTTFKMSKISSHCVAFASIFCLFLGMSTGAIFYNPYHEYNMIEASFYAGLHRSLWAVGTLGLIAIASYGHASLLYNVLSWQPAVILGKLVYGVYLVHMFFQLRAVGVARSYGHMNYFTVFSYALSDIVMSFALSFLLYVGIENPIRKLIKVLLSPDNVKKTVESSTNTNHQDVNKFSSSHL